MVLWAMSDRALPRSLRMMEGFGIHTFRFINADGISRFVKFHWKPLLGMHSVLWDEAQIISGKDPDFHRRDLWNAIQNGDFPEWQLGLQLFDEDFAERFDFDVLDATKLIPEEEVPVRIVGRLVLDKVVDNFFAETEQVAFCTQNIVPGIDFSNDPLLQGRNFSYLDTQLKRLGGPNFTHIPINAPKCPFGHFQGHFRRSLGGGLDRFLAPGGFGRAALRKLECRHYGIVGGGVGFDRLGEGMGFAAQRIEMLGKLFCVGRLGFLLAGEAGDHLAERRRQCSRERGYAPPSGSRSGFGYGIHERACQ